MITIALFLETDADLGVVNLHPVQLPGTAPLDESVPKIISESVFVSSKYFVLCFVFTLSLIVTNGCFSQSIVQSLSAPICSN